MPTFRDPVTSRAGRLQPPESGTASGSTLSSSIMAPHCALDHACLSRIPSTGRRAFHVQTGIGSLPNGSILKWAGYQACPGAVLGRPPKTLALSK
uniref:Uncharacterized protein n=1 Tax=Panagrellus redivivus TaxID=6233 RepID=A0A7E4ZVX5_PANRE